MNRMIKLTTQASLLSLAMAGLTTTALADGYAQDSSGATVKSGFGECVQTGYWDESMNTPECDPTLAARLEQERLEAERLAAAEQAARDAAARAAAAIQPAAAHMVTVSDEGDVAFAFDSAQLTDSAISELEKVAESLSSYSKIESISISGFTDSSGPETYNEGLSQRRAQEVQKLLSSKGVPMEAATVQGFGEAQPVASNTTREGRAQNRRVEIRIVGQRAQ